MAQPVGSKYPGVGVGVFIFKDGQVLFGRRLSKHAPNTWCPPGGKLDHGETWEQCAKRETWEEAGIKIKNVRLIGPTNDLFKESGLHYITIYMHADWASGQPTVKEPTKIVDWRWVDPAQLPKPLFLPVQNLIKSGFAL